MTPARLLRAADTLVQAQFAVAAGESVLITGDSATEPVLLDAIAAAVVRAGARPLVALAPQLPFQGGLSDPYVSDGLKAAAVASDVWFDLCFPYHAGSAATSAAVAGQRCRYLLLATAGADSFERLYGQVDLAALMDFNLAFAAFVADAAGETMRVTCPLGTDLTCTLDRPKLVRERVARTPGLHTVPGTQSFYPVPDSVRGRVVLQALFDEHHRLLRRPVTVVVDGDIRAVEGGGAEDRPSLERALRRASGGRGDFGRCIHFTFGFHPAARLTGRHFIEDIRVPGSNAVGMGLPWWEPGGGENHPDGVGLDQSLWIAGRPVAEAGRLTGPPDLKALHDAMRRRLD
jgi:2,5-dihydroxypyridine 5,6-dioxygenase